MRYCSEAELLSDINYKLLKAVDRFDPTKGSAFTFVSQVVTNVLCTSVTIARRSSNRFVELDEAATIIVSSSRMAKSNPKTQLTTWRTAYGPGSRPP